MLFSGVLLAVAAVTGSVGDGRQAGSQLAPSPITGVEGDLVNGVAQGVHNAAGGMSFFSLFMQADSVVKLVMIMLLLASIWSWAIIFEKLISLRTIRSKMAEFEKEFWSGISFDRLFKQLKGKEDHPLAMVFTAALDELQMRNPSSNTSAGHATTSERVRQAMQVSANKAMDLMERNLNFLATVGSTATFIGLLGTVWGIIVSFQAIAASKNTTLVVVAPGIAEALFATALGLIAAIPAMVFYNKFAAEVNKIGNQVHDFAIELNNMILREMDK